jgi:DNA-binding LytR/AlgR family response regulator
MWRGAVIGCALIAPLSIGYGAWARRAAGDPPAWPELAAGHGLNWTLCLVFVPAVAWMTVRLPVEGRRWPLALAAHLGADAALALVKMSLFLALGELSRLAGLSLSDAVGVDWNDQLIALVGLTAFAHVARLRIRKQQAGAAAPREHFAVPAAGGFRLVRPQEIFWADAQGNYARLHTAGGRHLIRSTMAGLERSLDPARFVRIHRRLIVNVDHVSRIDRHGPGTYRLSLADGSEVRSARSYHERVSRLLG